MRNKSVSFFYGTPGIRHWTFKQYFTKWSVEESTDMAADALARISISILIKVNIKEYLK